MSIVIPYPPARFSFAFISSAHVTLAFARGLIDLLRGPLAGQLEDVITFESGPGLAESRNEVARCFLEKCQAPLLLCADSDMAFNTSHARAVLSLTEQAGVVGARYRRLQYGRRVEESGYIVNGDFRPVEVGESPPELVDVDVVGTGLMAIRREVLLGIDPGRWWSHDVRSGDYGEDYAFCLRARAAGHRVALAARVLVPHMRLVGIT